MPSAEADRWCEAPALYDEHTLKIAGRDVMEDWELPYMRLLASIAASNGGHVLEVGYGMGLSAAAVQAHAVTSHTVLECHPEVAARCLTDQKAAVAGGRLHLLTGFWQDTAPLLASSSFDGILFDTYPITQDEFIGPHMFFFAEAHRLLRPGGVLTYYSDEARGYSQAHLDRLMQAGFAPSDIDHRLCEVRPPNGCEYWDQDTILAPVVRKGVLKL